MENDTNSPCSYMHLLKMSYGGLLLVLNKASTPWTGGSVVVPSGGGGGYRGGGGGQVGHEGGGNAYITGCFYVIT